MATTAPPLSSCISIDSSRSGGEEGGLRTRAGSYSSTSSKFKSNRVVDMDVPKDAYVKYTQALLRGRHPRSFRPVTAIWCYINKSDGRKRRVRKGKRLWSVIESDLASHHYGLHSSGGSRNQCDENLLQTCMSERSVMTADSTIDQPVADAMHRQKDIYYHEVVNRVPQLSCSLDSLLLTKSGTMTTLGRLIATNVTNRSMEVKGGRGGATAKLSEDRAKGMDTRNSIISAVPRQVHYNPNPTAPLYYGATISLESLVKAGHFLMVRWDSGRVVTDAAHASEKVDVVAFTALDIGQLDSYRPIKYGDSLWLQVMPGNGDLRWQNGSVLGTKVDHARILPTVPLDPGEECKQQEPPADHLSMGLPKPIKASLPRGKDDRIDEKHARQRNHRASSLGRWVIRPACDQMGRQGTPVLNHHLVFLEQDQAYLCQGPLITDDPTGSLEAKEVLLRQLPIGQRRKDGLTSSGCGLVVDRYGVFRVRVTEMDSVMEGMSNVEKKNELRMRKAKRNLKSSEQYRHGQRVYSQHRSAYDLLPLRGGERFPVEVRATMTDATFFSHAHLLEDQHRKEEEPHIFYRKKLSRHQKDLGQCVEYSRYFTDEGDHVVRYGPCPTFAREMYSRASNENAERKYHPSVRFTTPDAIPLMPYKLQMLRACSPSHASSMLPSSPDPYSLATPSAITDMSAFDDEDEDGLSIMSNATSTYESQLSISQSHHPRGGGKKNKKHCLCLLCESSTNMKLCAINHSIEEDLKLHPPQPSPPRATTHVARSLTPVTSSSKIEAPVRDPIDLKNYVTRRRSSLGSLAHRPPPALGDRSPASSPYSYGEHGPVTQERRSSQAGGAPMTFTVQPPPGPDDGDEDQSSVDEICSHLQEIDAMMQQNILFDEKKAKLKELQMYKQALQMVVAKQAGASGSSSEGRRSGSGGSRGSSVLLGQTPGSPMSMLRSGSRYSGYQDNGLEISTSGPLIMSPTHRASSSTRLSISSPSSSSHQSPSRGSLLLGSPTNRRISTASSGSGSSSSHRPSTVMNTGISGSGSGIASPSHRGSTAGSGSTRVLMTGGVMSPSHRGSTAGSGSTRGTNRAGSPSQRRSSLPRLPPVDLEGCIRLFGGNRKLLREMFISLERICTSRVIPKLKASVVMGRDDHVALQQLEFLLQASECLALPQLADAIATTMRVAQETIKTRQRPYTELQVSCGDLLASLEELVQTLSDFCYSTGDGDEPTPPRSL